MPKAEKEEALLEENVLLPKPELGPNTPVEFPENRLAPVDVLKVVGVPNDLWAKGLSVLLLGPNSDDPDPKGLLLGWPKAVAKQEPTHKSSI